MPHADRRRRDLDNLQRLHLTLTKSGFGWMTSEWTTIG
jgi:hypothetical protein